MLCRAVLAVLAVTCTFSPFARTIPQGTELAQLKDLVCVLWFSGLKKEDMDVNLLTKLRRHNINIDMNNETMQRECSVNKLALTSQTEKLVYVTTIRTILPTTIDQSNSTTAVSNDRDFEPIVKYITDNIQQLSSRSFVKENRETPRLPKVESARTTFYEPSYSRQTVQETNSIKKIPVLESKPRTLFSDNSNLRTKVTNDKDFDPNDKYITGIQFLSRRNFVDENRKTPTLPKVESARSNFFEPSYTTRNGQEIKDPVPESKLQNILSFWQSIAKSSDQRTQGLNEITNKRTPEEIYPKYKQQMRLPKSVTVTSSPYYSGSTQYKPVPAKWLAEFLSSTMNGMSVATSAERKSPNNLKELNLPFYRDLIHSYDSSQTIQDIVNGDVSRGLFNKLTSRNERPYTFDKKLTSLLRSTPSIGDNTKSNELFNNPFKFNMLQKKANTEKALRQGNQMDTSKNQQIERQVIRKNISRNDDGNQKITKQTIQDIADSVKAMILKDLGVLNVTISPTTTKVSLPPVISNTRNNATLSNDPKTATIIKPQNVTVNVYQIMDKIVDLFERLKVISDKINVTNDVKKTPAQQNEKARGFLNIKENLSETLQKNMFNRMTNVKHIMTNPFRDLTRQEIQKLPSIIQTNSGEIPPLLLPMPNPLKIINQVMVVSTATPSKEVNTNTRSRYKAFMEDLNKNRGHTSYEKNKSHKESNFLNYKKHSHFDKFDYDNSLKEIKKKYGINNDEFIRTHNFETQYTEGRNDKIKHNNNDNDKENEHINYFDYISNYFGNSAKIPTNGLNEKFHAKLENEDGRPDNQKIVGRNKDIFGLDTYNLGQHKEVFGHNKEVYGQNKEVHGHNKGVYGANKEIFRILDREYDKPVAPRQQQPLNMKNSPYDDTHFRNFLKTQQKVNDMLEKILETKNTLPYSVEMT